MCKSSSRIGLIPYVSWYTKDFCYVSIILNESYKNIFRLYKSLVWLIYWCQRLNIRSSNLQVLRPIKYTVWKQIFYGKYWNKNKLHRRIYISLDKIGSAVLEKRRAEKIGQIKFGPLWKEFDEKYFQEPIDIKAFFISWISQTCFRL